MQVHAGGIAERIRHVPSLHMATAFSLCQNLMKVLEEKKTNGMAALISTHKDTPLNVILCVHGQVGPAVGL